MILVFRHYFYILFFFFFFEWYGDPRNLHYPLRRQRQMCIRDSPIYGLYHSEEVVGEALKHLDRDKIILSTKCGLEWRHESPVLHKVVDGVQVYRDLSEKSILEDVEESLKRLGLSLIHI